MTDTKLEQKYKKLKETIKQMERAEGSAYVLEVSNTDRSEERRVGK